MDRLSRRDFLRVSAFASAGTILTACAQPAAPTTAPAAPTTAPVAPTTAPAEPSAPAEARYSEAPMLADNVTSGDLPPVEERLPENPFVAEGLDGIGNYGGTMRKSFSGQADGGTISHMSNRGMVNIDHEYVLHPYVAEAWEISEDAREYTFQLRKGLKWSDGAPMTAEDFRYYYEDTILNRDLTAAHPEALSSVIEGERVPATFSAPDDYTVKYTFVEPAALFYYWGTIILNIPASPKHYMSQFHTDYQDKATLDKMVADAGLEEWTQLYWDKDLWRINTERPTHYPWNPSNPWTDEVVVADRNPYFWEVDTAGNQLPYLDKVMFRLHGNTEVALMWAANGEIDCQARHIGGFTNYTVLKESESAGDYTVNCLGADGAMLAQRAFDAPEGVPRSDASSGQPVSVPFAVVMPFPPETVDIVLKHDDVALARVSRTEHAPTVAITYPNGGEVLDGVRTVTWSAWDTDGDALVYSVLHSADEGATWDVLAMDLREPRFEWDTRCAPGGTQTCLLQVVASDGINTTVNLSDGVFSVANKAPSAVIMAPCDGASVAQDLSVRLRGAAVDPEAGWLTGASLVWTSDRDGYLGTGQDLQVLLTPGAHVVTLTATDALGGVARHQVNVTVVDVPMLDVSLGGSGVLRGLSPTAYRPTWVGARVRVVGQGAAVHMHVYDGDPSAGGRLIGSRRLDLGANTDTAVGVPWTPSTAGDHSMWVVVSSEGATESSTANNEISGTVCVAAAEQAPIVVPLVLTSR